MRGMKSPPLETIAPTSLSPTATTITTVATAIFGVVHQQQQQQQKPNTQKELRNVFF